MQPNPAYGIELDPETQLDQCDQCQCWAPSEEMKRVRSDLICVQCDIDNNPSDWSEAK